ncbi:hypothetical protein [Streptomyces coelicoflavus]|uniref:hypothetical protein n=1 Tax=Streptomyces coelicoflavus TaxID=285562 RepID=UPI0036A8AACA
MSAREPGGTDGSTGSASDSGWFGGSARSPRGHGGPAADRTEILGARIGGQGRRVPSQDPSVQGRITWGTTGPAGADPDSAAPGNAPHHAAPHHPAAHRPAPNGAAPQPDLFGKAPYAAPAPGTGTVHARGTGNGGPDPDRTDVLPPAGPTRAFPTPAPAPAPASTPPPGPRTAALRDPWQELPDTDGDAGTGAGGHTHDPHEVTVQLDAVHLGDGMVLRADGGHRKSGPESSEGPVFVDASGRRSRLYRRIGILVGIACAVYAVVIVSTLLSGNSDAPWMPAPGQEEGAPAGQVDTTPLPSQPARPSGTGAAVPQVSPSAGAGAATAPGAEAPAPGTSGAPGVTGGAAGQPGTSDGPRTSASGTGPDPGGSGGTGPDPAQSAQSSQPATTGPSTPAGGGDPTAGPTESTGSTTGTDPGEGGTNANGAGAPDPVAAPAGAPVVAAGPAGTSTSPSSDSLSPENTL